MKKVFSFSRRYGVLVLATAAGAARADGVDVTSVTTAITAAGVAIGTVGAAYLAMRVGGKVFKWIQTAL
jgi:small-conductance mechanosensitive channel